MTTSRIVTRSRRSRFEGAFGEHFDLCTAGLRFRGFSFASTVKRVSNRFATAMERHRIRTGRDIGNHAFREQCPRLVTFGIHDQRFPYYAKLSS